MCIIFLTFFRSISIIGDLRATPIYKKKDRETFIFCACFAILFIFSIIFVQNFFLMLSYFESLFNEFYSIPYEQGFVWTWYIFFIYFKRNWNPESFMFFWNVLSSWVCDSEWPCTPLQELPLQPYKTRWLYDTRF